MSNIRGRTACRWIVAAAVVVTGGVVATATAGSSSADAVADKSRTIVTEDGWSLTVSKLGETVDRYPNLAATPFTREGFVSLQAVGDIAGKGKSDIKWGVLDTGYQIGCQVDVSNGLHLGLGFSIGPSVGLSIIGPDVGAHASVSPNVSTTLKPGSIQTVSFAKKSVIDKRASIYDDQAEVKVDNCMGPVTLRSFATITISTDTADNATTVYGDPIWL
ncbi:MspA family porin [Nocardia acidivorans]|uniref:MspA family porin n=1 Tax=Nocardia acidivorans TaxID=404580 RepID=UPI0008335684|nr:MspA family porin [Nocardia acidivorans]